MLGRVIKRTDRTIHSFTIYSFDQCPLGAFHLLSLMDTTQAPIGKTDIKSQCVMSVIVREVQISLEKNK